eukprot:3124204-Amphidinium_carterae.1
MWRISKQLAGGCGRKATPRAAPACRLAPSLEWDRHMAYVFGATVADIQPERVEADLHMVCQENRLGLQQLISHIRRQPKMKAVPSWAMPGELWHALLGCSTATTKLHELISILIDAVRAGAMPPQSFADGAVVGLPKPGGVGPKYTRLINLLDPMGKAVYSSWLQTLPDRTPAFQHGFTKGRGTRDCLLSRTVVSDRFARAHWCTGEQLWDVEKAFDRVARDKVLEAAYRTTESHEWVQGISQLYSRERMQLKVGGADGHGSQRWYLPSAGVRQGDNLGPRLFKDTFDEA